MTPTIDELFVAAAKKVVEVVRDCRNAGRDCRVALAGGSTPRGLYRLLTADPYRTQISWDHLRLFWGDERAVAPDHQESNFRMAQEALISHVPIPSHQVFRIEGEVPAGEAAARYETVLREQFNLSSGEVPQFDLILLGMGPDGHTASLFPGTSAVVESKKLVSAPWVEKLQTYRVTLTPRVLNAAKHVVFLVSGRDKATALQAVLEGPADPVRYPAQIVNPPAGHVVWLVNQDAAGLLKRESMTPRYKEGEVT
jgi:6-phosphogluconolactonase